MSGGVLRIPKRQVKVIIDLKGVGELEASLFVPPVEGEPEEEAVRQLLEERSQFFPCLQQDGDSVQFKLINKEQTLKIAVPLPERELDIPELYDMCQGVEATLTSGTTVRGDLLFSAPEDRRRLGDYLNQSDHFIPLNQASQVVLVNKLFIISAHEAPVQGEE